MYDPKDEKQIIYKAKKKNGLLSKSELEQGFKQYESSSHDDYKYKKSITYQKPVGEHSEQHHEEHHDEHHDEHKSDHHDEHHEEHHEEHQTDKEKKEHLAEVKQTAKEMYN